MSSNASQHQHPRADALQVAPGHLQHHPAALRGGCHQATALLHRSCSYVPGLLGSLGPHGSMHGCVQILVLACTHTFVCRHPAHKPNTWSSFKAEIWCIQDCQQDNTAELQLVREGLRVYNQSIPACSMYDLQLQGLTVMAGMYMAVFKQRHSFSVCLPKRPNNASMAASVHFASFKLFVRVKEHAGRGARGCYAKIDVDLMLSCIHPQPRQITEAQEGQQDQCSVGKQLLQPKSTSMHMMINCDSMLHSLGY